MRFRVASVQFRPDMGQLSDNLDRIAENVRQAKEQEGADLVVFPETAVSGYYVQGGANECSLTAQELQAELEIRLKGTGPVDVLIGFYEKGDGQPYNSAAYFEVTEKGAKCLGVYRKFFLPTYTVFDEERYVSQGGSLGLFETRFGKIGVLICEDAWHSILGTLLAVKGARVVATLIASPGRGFQQPEPSNVDRYRRMTRAVSEEHGLYSVTSMLTGFEGGKGLAGGSVVIAPNGEVIAQGDIVEDHMVVADIDLEQVDLARSKASLLDDLRANWSAILELAKED